MSNPFQVFDLTAHCKDTTLHRMDTTAHCKATTARRSDRQAARSIQPRVVRIRWLIVTIRRPVVRLRRPVVRRGRPAAWLWWLVVWGDEATLRSVCLAATKKGGVPMHAPEADQKCRANRWWDGAPAWG